jgi:predicted nuclease of predicted toxin-antitoxin system
MNLSPRWVRLLQDAGYDALRWSEVGAGDAPDHEVMAWAVREGCVVLTHDQDFNTLLAHSRTGKPSVVLLRTSSLRVDRVGERLLSALNVAQGDLEAGAILVVEDKRVRVRSLPIA